MISHGDNLNEVLRSLELYQKATRKSGVDVVNRMAKNTAIKTIMNLPILKSSEITKNNPETFKGRRFKNRLHYAKVAKRTPRGSGIKDAAIKSYNRAKSSRGFLKALFVNIVKDLGGNSSKTTTAGGSASRSLATLAKESIPYAKMKSGAINDDQHRIVMDAYLHARNLVARDMESYAREKMQKDANRYSEG